MISGLQLIVRIVCLERHGKPVLCYIDCWSLGLSSSLMIVMCSRAMWDFKMVYLSKLKKSLVKRKIIRVIVLIEIEAVKDSGIE